MRMSEHLSKRLNNLKNNAPAGAPVEQELLQRDVKKALEQCEERIRTFPVHEEAEAVIKAQHDALLKEEHEECQALRELLVDVQEGW